MWGYEETEAIDIETAAAELKVEESSLVEISTEWCEEDTTWDRFVYTETGKIVPTGTPIGVELEEDDGTGETYLYKGISFDEEYMKTKS